MRRPQKHEIAAGKTKLKQAHRKVSAGRLSIPVTYRGWFYLNGYYNEGYSPLSRRAPKRSK